MGSKIFTFAIFLPLLCSYSLIVNVTDTFYFPLQMKYILLYYLYSKTRCKLYITEIGNKGISYR